MCINDGLECPMGSFGNNNKLSITENYATGVIVKSGNKSFNGGSNGKVVIEAANQISGTAKVVYEAPSVLLKPGFKATATPQQAVFIAKVGNGCYQDPSANVRIRTDK